MRTEALPSLIFSACPVYCLHAGAVQASHFYLLHVSIHSLTSPTSLFIIHGLPANSYNRWTVSVPHSMFKCHPQQRSHRIWFSFQSELLPVPLPRSYTHHIQGYEDCHCTGQCCYSLLFLLCHSTDTCICIAQDFKCIISQFGL